ncbi:MAG: hypothetical protein HC828_03505 [Blastochloris sp.]|nr:hypothetical protein [Blastochloris sp.]
MSNRDLPAILDDLFATIRQFLRAGFESPDTIVALAIEQYADATDPTLLRPHARRMTQELLRDLLAEQAIWPAITDCDRLDMAFAQLQATGIVCRQDFSCCGTCGAYEIWDEIATVEDGGGVVHGYAFYHTQDTESALEGYGLYLNYGARLKGEVAALAVAAEIVAALQQHGLTVDWNGSWDRRIGVTLDWKRRRSPSELARFQS